jgi:hypothetical protein
MVTLRRDSNGNFSARKRLPDEVRDGYGQRYGQRVEVKFFASASKGTAEAKRLFQEWEAEVAKRIAGHSGFTTGRRDRPVAQGRGGARR